MRRRATVAGFGWRHGNGVALLIKPRCRNRRQSRPACGEMPLPGPHQIRPVAKGKANPGARRSRSRIDPRRCVPRALPSRSPLSLSYTVLPSVRPTRRRVYIGYLAVHGLFPLRCVPNSVMFPKPSSSLHMDQYKRTLLVVTCRPFLFTVRASFKLKFYSELRRLKWKLVHFHLNPLQSRRGFEVSKVANVGEDPYTNHSINSRSSDQHEGLITWEVHKIREHARTKAQGELHRTRGHMSY
jgi:hypothetical protein